MLIIMDNVVDPRLLDNELHDEHTETDLIPLKLGCNLLYTTRSHFHIPVVAIQPVGILKPDDAYTL